MSDEIKADVDKALGELRTDMNKAKAAESAAGTWVKVHFVWIAGLLGVLGGFILGKVV